MDITKPSKFLLLLLKLEGKLKTQRYKTFCDKLDLKGNEKVLEFGCGWGGNSVELASRLLDGSLLCIDISQAWIDLTRQKLSNQFNNVHFLCGDITKLQAEKETIDCIVIHRVLHDIAPEQRAEVVKALRNWLKPDGRICIMEPLKPSHGMPLEEIRSVFSVANLQEKYSEIIGKSSYSAYTLAS